MNIDGKWLSEEIYIENDVLWRKTTYEGEQMYHTEMVITKEEFELCMKEWGNND